MFLPKLTFIYPSISKLSNVPCSPQEGVERSAPLPGDFRVIVGPIQAQMDDFCDLHGTPDTPVSRIVTVKVCPYGPG